MWLWSITVAALWKEAIAVTSAKRQILATQSDTLTAQGFLNLQASFLNGTSVMSDGTCAFENAARRREWYTLVSTKATLTT